MSDVAENADWLKAERLRLGLSAAQVATAAMAIASEAGDSLSLTQQSVSGFENGRWKTVPRWMRYVRQALGQPSPSPVTKIHDPAVFGLSIPMNVLLPNEAALSRMFEGLLAPLDLALPKAELAEALARRLPSGLSQVQGPLLEPVSAAAPDHDAVAPPPATDRPGLRSEQRT